MSKNGKSQFYYLLQVDKQTRNAIRLYRKSKHQVIRGFSYFTIEDTKIMKNEERQAR